VVLLDDDDHSYDYVIEMAQALFAHPIPRAVDIAKTVDTQGRAILLTTHREHAELKVEQVHGFGADPRIASCKGAMSAIMEPAPGGDDDDVNR
jgi:ATP-dependent Clp protease adaptor protein ClpS